MHFRQRDKVPDIPLEESSRLSLDPRLDAALNVIHASSDFRAAILYVCLRNESQTAKSPSYGRCGEKIQPSLAIAIATAALIYSRHFMVCL